MISKSEENLITNYEALKVYIDEHHHLPSKDSGLNAKYLLNWVKYQRKRMKADLMPDVQKTMLLTLLASRSDEHTGGRRKKQNE